MPFFSGAMEYDGFGSPCTTFSWKSQLRVVALVNSTIAVRLFASKAAQNSVGPRRILNDEFIINAAAQTTSKTPAARLTVLSLDGLIMAATGSPDLGSSANRNFPFLFCREGVIENSRDIQFLASGIVFALPLVLKQACV